MKKFHSIIDWLDFNVMWPIWNLFRWIRYVAYKIHNEIPPSHIVKEVNIFEDGVNADIYLEGRNLCFSIYDEEFNRYCLRFVVNDKKECGLTLTREPYEEDGGGIWINKDGQLCFRYNGKEQGVKLQINQ